MKWSIKIAKIAGIKIYMHWTFLLLLAWVVIANIRAGSSWVQAVFALGFIFAIFLCVVLHELGHALVAKHFKYTTRDIILLPIGGMARMDIMPEKPREEFLVAIAGPLVNFAIATLLWPFIYWFGTVPNFITVLLKQESSFLFNIFMVNLFIGAFNLIPAFPMDGGRILRALLSMRMPRMRATQLAARIGQFIAVLFFFAGLFYNPFLSIIGVFVFITAQAETELVRSHSVLNNYKVKDVMMHRYYSLDSSAPIMDAVNLFMDVQAYDFLVTEHGFVIGTLNREDIVKTLAEKGNSAMVLDAMKTNVTFLAPDTDLDKAYQALSSSGRNIIPVKENNQVIGIVDLNHILELIKVQEAQEYNVRHMHHHIDTPKAAA